MAKPFFLWVAARGGKKPVEEYEGLEFTNTISDHPSSIDLKTHEHDEGHFLPRFWLRTLTCIFAPIIVAGYYAGLYTYWVRRYDDGGPVAQGPPAGRWAYYIWFVVNAVGIGLSKYGLAGVEAGMLMDKRWAAQNAMQLMSHCEKTWSGPTGWLSMRTRPSATWFVLAAVSVTPYIVFPLSGFTLQLTNGYSSSNSSKYDEPVLLVGQTQNTFLDQTLADVFSRSFSRWSTSTSSTLTSRSAYYLPSDNSTLLDRTWLQSFPNTWPDALLMTVFIAPQSPSIISGSVWGLESSFKCTTVSDIKDFTLLSQRNSDGTSPRCPPITFNSSDATPEYDGLPDLCDFDVYTLNPIDNASLAFLNGIDSSYFPVGTMEMAVGYNKSEWESIPFSNLDPVTIEAALWQNPIKMVTQDCPTLNPLLSNALGTTVKGMQKTFALDNITSILTGDDDTSPKTLDAIGVRCTSRYRTGTATIDGRTGTYDSFSYEEGHSIVSATPVPIATAIPRIFRSEVSAALNLQDMYAQSALSDTIASIPLDFTTDSNMDLNPMAYIASNVSWLQNIYKSVDAFYRQPMYCDGDPSSTDTWQQLQLLNSDQFTTSLVKAFKAYALEMARPAVAEGRYQSPSGATLFAVSPTLIISPGDVSGWPVVILLAFWAGSCAVLGVVFGARRRWSETLDGFSMFRFGADFPNFNVMETRSTVHYSRCMALCDIPGQVGDARPETSPGYISLVDGDGNSHEIRRRKRTRTRRRFL